MTERLQIADIGHRGDGIADTAAGAAYVPYTLPGEIVDVEDWPGHPDRRRLVAVVQPSPQRIEPFCPHFGTCGGCAIQHWAEPHYRAWKRDLVVAALHQAGIAAEVGDLVDAHGEGRRRAVFHARRGTHDVLQVGFAAPLAHHIVPIDRCPILAPGLSGALKAAWAIAELLDAGRKPLDIHVTATDGGIDIDIRGSGPLQHAVTGALARLADEQRLARLTRHGELIARRTAPTLRMGRATVSLPAGAFLQATAAGETTLAQLAASYLDGARSIADLFAGVGPFALRLAERARIVAADADEAAIAAMRDAARNTQGLKPIEAQTRDLFRRPFVPLDLVKIDAVLFDPPRQGAEAQARELAKSKVPVIVAVSCNVASFVRDAKLLIEGGYKLGAVTPVDQFRHSTHVELVARFSR